MAETHELRLKINAAAAKRGSRDFVSAVNAIKTAVRGLDRDSSGVFTTLNKNMKALSGSKVKIGGLDKRALIDLDSYAKLQRQALSSTTATKRGVTTLMTTIRGLSDSYSMAQNTMGTFNKSLLQTNTNLSRQITLADQLRSSVRQVGTAPAGGARTAATGGAGAGAATAANKAAEQQIGLQNRVRRAIDDSRFAAEGLTTSLMRVGGFESINKVGVAFRQLQTELGKSVVSTEHLDNAKTRFNSTMKAAKTSLTTLNAKVREEARAARDASSAEVAKAKSVRDAAAAARDAAKAESVSAAASKKNETAKISAANAMHRAEVEAARLSARMRSMGDTRGVAALSQAVAHLRANLGSGSASTKQIQKAMSDFAAATSKAKIAIIQSDSAQNRAARTAKNLATQERAVASQARAIEREMRSVAGATNATSTAFRKATGSMRGMENAFSATYQVGTAFRGLLGTFTLGSFTKSIYGAGDALDQFRVTMEIAGGSAAAASREIDFIDEASRGLGLNLREARDDFSKFAVSASLAGVSMGQTRDIFESVAMAMSVLGKSSEDQRLAFLALEQMMSKGVISSEELRRQLGERMPGAVNLMAQAVGVTTSELQKMLKAGELVSSEVLPKFAERVREVFGPGFEAATGRAGFNLRTLKAEFEKFLEVASQSGMMQGLAGEFRNLTQMMRSPQARDAAKALGEGVAKLATGITSASKIIIGNLEEIGMVAKAVFAGVVARQAALLVNGLVNMGQQVLAMFASWSAGTPVMTQATAASVANTEAMTANTVAMTLNAKAAGKRSTAIGGSAAAEQAALTTTLRANGVFGTSTVATTAAAGGFARMAAGAATLSRGLAVMAGPIGIAIAAITLLPMLLKDSGDAAEDMGARLDGAIRRAGVSLEEFNNDLGQTASNMALIQMLTDLETFSTAATADMGALVTTTNGLKVAMMALNDETSVTATSLNPLNKAAQDARIYRTMLDEVGIGLDSLTSMSGSAKDATKELITMAFAAMNGQGSFLAMREAANLMMIKFPTSANAIGEILALTETMALSEVGAIKLTNTMVDMYGSSDDQVIKNMIALGSAVIKTRDGFAELQSDLDQIVKTTPHLADEAVRILDATRRAMETGGTSKAFEGDMRSMLVHVEKTIQALRASSADASAAFDAAGAQYESTLTQVWSGLESMGVGDADIAIIGELVAQFDRFKSSAIAVEDLGTALQTTASHMVDTGMFNTDQVEEYTTAISTQFSLLDEGAQTYDGLRRVMEEVGATDAGIGMEAFGVTLDNTITRMSDMGINAAGLQTMLAGMYPDGSGANSLIQHLIKAAAELEETGQEANWAAEMLENFINKASEVAQLADDLHPIADAFTAIAAATDELSVKTRDIIAEMAERNRIAMMPEGAEKDVAEYFASYSEGGKLVAEAAAEIELLQLQIKALGVGSGSPVAVELNDRITALQGVLATFETSAGSQVREAYTPPKGSSRKEQLTDEEKAVKSANDAILERIAGLKSENLALELLAGGHATTIDNATLLADAMIAGGGAVDEQTKAMIRQIEAAEQLNKRLTDLARDPVKEWIDSVPSWIAAGQQIEMEVIESLSNSIADFAMTGKFDFESFGQSILSTATKVIADKAVVELMNMFGLGGGDGEKAGLDIGGIFDSLFSSGEGDGDGAGMAGIGEALSGIFTSGSESIGEAITSSMSIAGGDLGSNLVSSVSQVSTTMSSGLTSALSAGTNTMTTGMVTAATTGGAIYAAEEIAGGAVAGAEMNAGIVSGGAVAAASMGAASAGGSLAGGGGGGGLLDGFLSLFGFKDGGISNSPTSINSGFSAPAAAFKHAPQFASGTTNTSGIPAILHDNEAVIPLSKGRKIPVEMASGGTGDGGTKIIEQHFNISTPDADSFRRSQSQIAADGARSAQRALAAND